MEDSPESVEDDLSKCEAFILLQPPKSIERFENLMTEKDLS